MATAGPNLAGAGADDATVGTQVWSNTANITADAGTFALVSLSACFKYGTMVATPNGDVLIENLLVGDTVYAFDMDKNLSLVIIQSIHDDNASTYIELTIGDIILSVTPEHPIYSAGQFVFANELAPGDLVIVLKDGVLTDTAITSTRIVIIDNAIQVRTISVDTPNTFFANGVGVHNKG